MDKQEITAEMCNEHIAYFKKIYSGNEEENPIPEKEKVTVFCTNGTPEHTGFAIDVYAYELGFDLLIAKSWILHKDLLKLIESSPHKTTI